jgi:hypothetical protein
MTSLRRSHPRPTSERGAVLVFTAILLLVLIGFAALAVDLGNAWSNDRLGQTTSDVTASGSLFEVPRTFADPLGPGDLVDTEVQAEVDALVLANVDPGVTAAGTATVSYPPGAVEVAVDVTIDSVNAFARAINAGSVVQVDSSATARVEPQATDKLLPIGFYAPALDGQSGSLSQPYQCVNVDVPAGTASPRVCSGIAFDDGGNGLRNRLLGMTRLGASPPDCDADIVDNFIVGVDHLVDTLAEGIRTEGDACNYGHLLTLPSAADAVVLPPFSTILDDATIGPGAPLASPSNPLWTYLVAAQPEPCDSAWYADPARTLEEQSNQMRVCLRTWNGSAQLFTSGVVDSPRFGWGIDIRDDGGAEEFEAPILVFLNTLVPDVGPLDDPTTAQYLDGPSFTAGAPGANVGGLTMYSIAPRMLSSSDRASLVSPFYDVDLLELTLVD